MRIPGFIAGYAKAWVAAVLVAVAETVAAEGPNVRTAVAAALTFFATALIRNRPPVEV
jgi:hypothetical protein